MKFIDNDLRHINEMRCNNICENNFIDLGNSPPSNAFLKIVIRKKKYVN